MRINNRKWKTLGRRIIVLLLLCGLLLPIGQYANAASILYTYTWIQDKSGLPADDQWHDYFIAWEDLDEANKWWFTDYHWFTVDGKNNYDVGSTHWMQYQAISTLPDWTSTSFTSKESLGHMQIKYAGIDQETNFPQYYIRVSKMSGGYVYFTRYYPTNNEKEADAFVFQDMGEVFHIFVSISGKADRYLTRDGQELETTESSSYGGGEYYRHMRVYQRTYVVEGAEEGSMDDMLGKVTLHEYHWINTKDELLELANKQQWVDILLAWEDCDGSETWQNNSNIVWYTKETWQDASGQVNYQNGSWNELYYWSNDYIGSDGYARPSDDIFLLPDRVGHFQIKGVGWNDSIPMMGVTGENNSSVRSPLFQLRFEIGRQKYLYIGNDEFEEDPEDAEDFTVQLFVEEDKRNTAGYYYGSVYIFADFSVNDEYLTRLKNCFDIGNDWASSSWEYPFRIYAYYPVEYDAIVKSFTVGKGASYCIDQHLILAEGVTITVEDGGVLVVDQQLLNNGNIVVNKGGTLIVNEGGYIMAYSKDAQGRITINGGNMIVMDNAKVVCDRGEGALLARNGATIINRGVLMVSNTIELRNNSYLKNESVGTVVLGGVMKNDRGNIANLNRDQILENLPTNLEKVVFLCSSKSKFWNYGILSRPWWYEWHDESNGFVNQGEIRDDN